MRNKRLESMLDRAPEALISTAIVSENRALSAYNGAIAAFGAGMRNMGLKAMIMVYENKAHENKGSGSPSKTDKPKILRAIEKVLNIQANSLYEHVSTNQRQARRDVELAATALKLSLRSFELVEEKQ